MLDNTTRTKVYKEVPVKKRFFYSDVSSGEKLFSIAQKYDLHNDEAYKKFAITVGDIILGFYRIEDTVPLLQQELGISPMVAARLGVDVLDFLAPLSDPNWQPPADFMNEEEENEDDELGVADDGGVTPTYQAASVLSTAQPVVSPASVAEQPTYNPIPNIPTSTILTHPPVTPPYHPPVVSEAPTIPAMPVHSTYQPVGAEPLRTMASDMAHARGPQQNLAYEPAMDLHSEPTYTAQSQEQLRQPLSDVPSYQPTATSSAHPIPNPDPPRWTTG
jgi:hypothetical protein